MAQQIATVENQAQPNWSRYIVVHGSADSYRRESGATWLVALHCCPWPGR